MSMMDMKAYGNIKLKSERIRRYVGCTLNSKVNLKILPVPSFFFQNNSRITSAVLKDVKDLKHVPQ